MVSKVAFHTVYKMLLAYYNYLALYSACLLSALRVRAHGRLVTGVVAHDMPILHRALKGGGGVKNKRQTRGVDKWGYGEIAPGVG